MERGSYYAFHDATPFATTSATTAANNNDRRRPPLPAAATSSYFAPTSSSSSSLVAPNAATEWRRPRLGRYANNDADTDAPSAAAQPDPNNTHGLGGGGGGPRWSLGAESVGDETRRTDDAPRGGARPLQGQLRHVHPAERLARAREASAHTRQRLGADSSPPAAPRDQYGADGDEEASHHAARRQPSDGSNGPEPPVRSTAVPRRRVTVSSFFDDPVVSGADKDSGTVHWAERARNGGDRAPPLHYPHDGGAAAAAPSSSAGGGRRSGGHVTTSASDDGEWAAELRRHIPTLSAQFTCSPGDAHAILQAIESREAFREVMLYNSSFHHGGADGESPARYRARLEERISALEFDNNTLQQKIERRDDEIDKWKGEAGEAKERWKALEAQTRQTLNLVSQKREEGRRQLLMEEGKVSKLQFQVKTLQAEVDRLKEKLHAALSHK